MNSNKLGDGPPIDVAVIGSGPSGLAAATELKKAGVNRVVVLEREGGAGGIPRHCAHSPYGLREFKRILKGPAYAARLVRAAKDAGVEISTMTTVVEARRDGKLLVAAPEGVVELSAKRVVLATGVREAPRSARLVSGARVAGVVNTGALQSMVHLKGVRPFKRPVIIGSELVAFSAILTCRAAGVKPVAMVEQSDRITARWPSSLLPKLQGIPVFTGMKLVGIEGEAQVEAVLLQCPHGTTRRLNCDGVIFSGQFTPDATLARCGHLEVDATTGGPLVDQWGRTSDRAYFATGNLLRPVETAGWSWAEGQRTGQWVAADLAGKLPMPDRCITVSTQDDRLKFIMPQRLCLSDPAAGMGTFQLRVTQPVSGRLIAAQDGNEIWSCALSARPERRVLVPMSKIASTVGGGDIEFRVSDARD
ncbi:NAD(P)/FAD-dependent oxidoreductase [Litoreibacter janthinus]|uniref:Thioredoxin reductase n=1 Tax=Litoreibacter janthinus TaxID=670154 RepID=A0A1I6GV51_9RHOB|nr:FAD-dependent oxidoreductase [Litoreibacter janthinus]SFR46153.1 Thioredoxin reductase [Litoreibacter janthinus]